MYRGSLVIVLIFLINSLFAQSYDWQKALISSGISFVGGAANGLHETIYHHYPKFKKVHPNANDNYWNPQISWKNKYSDWDNGDTSEKYFGSKTFLVWTTDAKHLLSLTSNMSLIGSTCVITIGEKRPWWHYAIDLAASGIARSAGFHLTYNLIYK